MGTSFEVIEHPTGRRLGVGHATSKAYLDLLAGHRDVRQQKIGSFGCQVLENEVGRASQSQVHAIGLYATFLYSHVDFPAGTTKTAWPNDVVAPPLDSTSTASTLPDGDVVRATSDPTHPANSMTFRPRSR